MFDNDYVEDGTAYIKVFVKDAPDDAMLNFIDSLDEQEYDDELNDGYYGWEWETPEKTDYKLELSGPPTYCHLIEELIDKTIANFPDLHLLKVIIISDIANDGRGSFTYSEIEKGKKTALAGRKDIAYVDYNNNDEETLEALNKALENDLFPLVKKWLKEASAPKEEKR